MNCSTFGKMFLAAAVPFCLSASVVHAANIETLTIKKQTSHYMSMSQTITRIAVGNPDIASVVQLPGSASEFLIVTKKENGSTALFVWTADGMRHEYLIIVSPEDPGRAMLIEQAINLPDVHVKIVDERILLTGTVENQYEKNYALQTARLFVDGNTESSLLVGSGFDMKLETTAAKNVGRSKTLEATKSETKGQIIDLLQILHPTQIRLEAQIIEINSEDAKNLGLYYGTDPVNAPGIFSFGEDYNRAVEPIPFRHNPWRWTWQHRSSFNVRLTALITQDKAKILSRPNVTTLSGEQATIQIGGEIPYSTYDDDGKRTTEFKDYGIILQFRPVVDAQNRINSAVHAEVSQPDGETPDGQITLMTRTADSVISLNSGSPIVIGGLIDSTERKVVEKIPLLGDIPIIGEFFKHTSKNRDKSELIIVVTPYLVGEEEISQSPMSEAMRQWYEQEQKYRDAMENFDFKTNKPVAEESATDDEDEQRILPPPKYPITTDKPFNN